MTNRYPLIIDTADGNKIKELPNGDNLDLQGSGIVNAASIEVVGSITADSITLDGQTLSDVAYSGSYNDLFNTPSLFSGNYNDLTNKPSIPSITRNFTDVADTVPQDGEALIYNATNGRYEPTSISAAFDAVESINDLSDVITTGETNNKFLKYYSGAWRPANVTWGEVTNAPTSLSDFVDDINAANTNLFDQDLNTTDSVTFQSITTTNITGDFTGSVFADDSTLLVDSVAGKIVGNVDTSVVETNLIISQGGNLNATGATLIVGAANGTAQGGPTLVGGGVGTAGNGGSVSLFGGPGSNGNGGAVFISSGAGTGGDSGDISIVAAAGTVNGGDVYIGGGSGGSGTDGKVIFTGDVDFTNAGTVSGFVGNVTGDVAGSVFADDSALLVDAVNGTIPGYVSIEDLKTALQDGAGDYAAFKAWVLANL